MATKEMQEKTAEKTATKSAVKLTAKKQQKAAAGAQANFAVIKTGGKQYRVSEGSIIKIEKIAGEHKIGDKVSFNEVLMTNKGTAVTLGTPNVSGAEVAGEIVDISRHPKVIIYKYKQKSRSGTAKKGHRQPYFQVKITAVKM
jgi:large subunit ribosomal protein L21